MRAMTLNTVYGTTSVELRAKAVNQENRPRTTADFHPETRKLYQLLMKIIINKIFLHLQLLTMRFHNLNILHDNIITYSTQYILFNVWVIFSINIGFMSEYSFFYIFFNYFSTSIDYIKIKFINSNNNILLLSFFYKLMC